MWRFLFIPREANKLHYLWRLRLERVDIILLFFFNIYRNVTLVWKRYILNWLIFIAIWKKKIYSSEWIIMSLSARSIEFWGCYLGRNDADICSAVIHKLGIATQIQRRFIYFIFFNNFLLTYCRLWWKRVSTVDCTNGRSCLCILQGQQKHRGEFASRLLLHLQVVRRLSLFSRVCKKKRVENDYSLLLARLASHQPGARVYIRVIKIIHQMDTHTTSSRMAYKSVKIRRKRASESGISLVSLKCRAK